MTNFDFNVTINETNYYLSDNGKSKFITEVYAGNIEKSNSLHGKFHHTYSKNQEVENLHINLEEATNYLVQLFYKTGQKYSCSRTKIGKLLSIVAFKYVVEDKNAFDEIIYKYNDCGTAFNELKLYTDRDVYIKVEYFDDKEYIKENLNDEINEVDAPDKYKGTKNLPNEFKNRVQEVFREFGAYSAIDLGECINALVDNYNITKPNGEIDLLKINELSKKFHVDSQTSKLIQYLLT